MSTTMEMLPLEDLAEHAWRALPWDTDRGIRASTLSMHLAHKPNSTRVDKALRHLHLEGRAWQIGGWWWKS